MRRNRPPGEKRWLSCLRICLRIARIGLLGLYDQDGVLRCSGLDQAECLAYAELFALAEGAFSIEPLFAAADPGSTPRPQAGCSN